MKNWKLIPHRCTQGAENMRIDRQLLDSISAESSPTIRFYSWNPECISLGYFQKPEEQLNLALIEKEGIDVVNRFTGGRAVLHSGELTYSVVGSIQSDIFKTLDSTFMHISTAICKGLQSLDIPADLKRGTVKMSSEDTPLNIKTAPPCFASTSKHELVINDKKIVGSAQRRTKQGFIQHGSIMLNNRFQDLGRYLLNGSGHDGKPEPFATSIGEETHKEFSKEELQESMVAAFTDYFDVDFDL